MSRFNLTFSGVILPGRDPQRARARFAEIFEIRDRYHLERYFTGETTILRRNLDRREAGEYYARMRKHGLEGTLVKIEIGEKPVPPQNTLPPVDESAQNAASDIAPEQATRKRRHERAGERKQQRKQSAAARKQARMEQKRLQREAREQKKREADAQRRAETESRRKAGAQRKAGAEAQRKAEADARHQQIAERRARKPAQAQRRAQKAIRSRLGLSPLETTRQREVQTHSREAPNPYRLQPFRNTEAVRFRGRRARDCVRRGLLTAGGALALLLILLGAFLAQRPAPTPSGPSAIAATDNGHLYLLVDEQLLQHDRAGVPEKAIPLADLGLTRPTALLLPAPGNTLLLRARALDTPQAAPALWRCQPEQGACERLPGGYSEARIDALVRHPLSGDLILADAAGGTLLRLSSEGERVARAERQLPENPVLRLDTGLLMINSASAPAVSVYRIEPGAFGRQIDELLLLAPVAIDAGQTRVLDFLQQDGNWWASLRNPDTGSTGTYLFDGQWNYLREIDRDAGTGAARLVRWNRKVLLSSPQRSVIQRFNTSGDKEAPFTSPLLENAIESERRWQRLLARAWGLALLLCATALILGAAYSAIHFLRQRVYGRQSARGADPLDTALERVEWLPAAPHRLQQLRRSSTACLALALVIVAIAIALGVDALQLLALLIALAGPLILLQTLLRSPVDHVGLLGDRLVLVDHHERYHSGDNARTAYRGPFLFIDDIVVYTGTALLPAIDTKARQRRLAPRLRGASRAPWTEVLTRLRESKHPLARGGTAAIAALTIGLLVIAVGQVMA